jgi:hypothetical protein
MKKYGKHDEENNDYDRPKERPYNDNVFDDDEDLYGEKTVDVTIPTKRRNFTFFFLRFVP